MGDLASGFVSSALSLAHDRLSGLLAMDSRALLEAIAPELTPDPALAAADVALTRTKGRLRELESALLTVPQDLGQAEVALRALSATVQSMADGCREVVAALPAGAASAETMVVRLAKHLLRDAEIPVRGLLRQFALPPKDGEWTATQTSVGYRIKKDEQIDVAPGVALSGLVLTLDVRFPDPRLTITVTADVELALDAGPLTEILPGEFGATSRFTVTVDSVDGVTVGERQRRVYLPVTPTAAGVDLRELGFGLSDHIPGLELTTQLRLSLAAGIAASIDGTGLAVELIPGSDAPIQVTTVDPTGVALKIDAGLVRGGGYLARHDDSFVGTLVLTIGPTSAKAVVLLSTDPFSLVVLFFAEFTAAIQLSFGFTLNGIGGLLAVNRTVSRETLQARIWDGSADALLFPEDPGQANQQLLESVFPPEDGAVAVGPAFMLGWGTPISLMVAKVGVMLVLPDPSVVIIGKLRVAIPSPALPIIDLNVGVYGEITPDRVLVIAGLAGSKMAGFTLSGDFGLLTVYGARPVFALSAGGFHPRFSPPGPLAKLRRITVDMSPPILLTLRAEAYVALTSSAFMVGARVEAGIDFGVASAHGQIAFDAIVLWNPVHFEVDLRALVEVEVGGVTVLGVAVALHIEGPGVWVAHGTASIDFFFLPTLDLEVGPLTWGDRRVEQPVTVSPAALVIEQLRDRAAWQPQLPKGGEQLISFSDQPSHDPTALLAHPLGGFEARQKLVPLETNLQHHGGYGVSEHRITLGRPLVGGTPAASVTTVKDLFATGQFQQQSDDQKLSQPEFASLPSGVNLAAAPSSFGAVVGADVSWRTVYPGQLFEAGEPESFSLDRELTPHLLVTSAAGRFRAQAEANPYGRVDMLVGGQTR